MKINLDKIRERADEDMSSYVLICVKPGHHPDFYFEGSSSEIVGAMRMTERELHLHYLHAMTAARSALADKGKEKP